MSSAMEMRIERPIKVGTYDIDFAGHVSNIAYLRWLEDARGQLFDKYFSLSNFMAEGKCPVLASTNIQYKRAIKLFDKPTIHMWVSDVGKTSMTISAEVFVADQLMTTVQHVIVFIDLATGRPIRLPKAIHEVHVQP
jgi:acyl-CoA thioester hydrolase